ncbi:MAG: two-component system, cell cycle sensor histidine kinase and response regulator CckA, partial [Gemmatimonadaceae bacterium]|nr:two-component system, cell cycle sensor histidine kinase and response regulator CckA [Gemmatimonadaceae bacterium]
WYEGALQDITERREAEARLQRERRYFANLFEGLPDAIAILDQDDRVVRINSHFTTLFEYTPEEAVGRKITELIVPHESVEEGVDISRRVAAGQTVEAQLLRRTRGGRLVSVSLLGTPFNGPGGEANVYAVYRDNTAQVQSREALEKSQRRFQSMIENGSDMITIFTLDGRRTYISPSLTKTLGESETDLIGQSVLELIHPDDQKKAADFIRWLSAHPGETGALEYRWRRPSDGEWRLLSAVAKNLAEDPSVGGIIVNARDITDERELQEQVRRSHKMEAIGRLAGGIAHDFNNLLTVIGSCADFVLGDSSLPAEHCADLVELRKATDRATALTRQLLAFGRGQVLRPSTLDLNERLSDVMPMLTRLFESAIEITIDTTADLWWVRADPGQIEQVLLNLALNARDAMPEGGKLTFTTENIVIADGQKTLGKVYTKTPGEYVLLKVRDTGTGMDETTQRRIFEPFFTTKETGKGTGLGLATSYGIVKQSGGYIEVRTAPGKGAEFFIYLPRTELKTDQFELTESTSVLPAAGTILVVEDEQGVRQSLLRILAAEGYKVLSAANGKEGLAAFETHADGVDLLITDIVMPGMGGRDLARKCSELRKTVKVLYVSGYTKDSLLSQQTFDDGIEFLEKPFTRESVLKTVRQALR